MLKLFPGVLAGGLALVYVLGAVVTGSEFAGEGIDPGEGVPLLSIDQLLARGVGVLVKPGAILVAAMLAITCLQTVFMYLIGWHWSDIGEKLGTDGDQDNPKSKKLEVRLLGLFGLLAIGLLFAFQPIDRLLGGVVVFGGTWLTAAVFLLWENARGWKPFLLLLPIFFFIIGLGISTYTDPDPLGDGKILLSGDGKPVEGIFVTHSNSTWYLFDEDASVIRGVPDKAVQTAVIETRPDPQSNDSGTLLEEVVDRAPDLWPPF